MACMFVTENNRYFVSIKIEEIVEDNFPLQIFGVDKGNRAYELQIEIVGAFQRH